MPQSEGGIYVIVNTITKDFYIGSTKNFTQRKIRHFQKLRDNAHPNKFMQRSYNKYGEDAFSMYILERVEDLRTENLLSREQDWIDRLVPTFNHKKIVTDNFGEYQDQNRNAELKEAKKERWVKSGKQNLDNYRENHKQHSDLHKQHLREAARKRWANPDERKKTAKGVSEYFRKRREDQNNSLE